MNCTCNYPYPAMYEGGGVPDSDWNDPAPWAQEPNDVRDSIFREVTVKLRKDIGLLQSTLRTEMEAHVEKLVGEVCTIL